MAALSVLLVIGLLPRAAVAQSSDTPNSSQAPLSDGASPAQGEVPSFTDVSGNTHEPAIAQLVGLGITQGTTPVTYGPAQPVTRGQMATFLVRLLTAYQVALPPGSDAPETAGFADISGTTHEASIRQVAAAGIAQGLDEVRFAPDAVVRRDQMASFLTRTLSYALYIDLEDAAVTGFEDIDGNVHAASIGRLVGAGITQGTSPTTYEPAAAVRRDQMASFLIRTGVVLSTDLDRQPQPIGEQPTDEQPEGQPEPDDTPDGATPIRPPRDPSDDAPVELILTDDTIVLDEDIDAPILSYDPGSGELVFDAVLADQIPVGSVLVADVSDAAPYGLLRRVTAAETVGEELILATGQATLTDVFDQADIYLRDEIDYTTIAEVETFIDGMEVVNADGIVASDGSTTDILRSRSDIDIEFDASAGCDLTAPESPETLRLAFGCGTEASVVFEVSETTETDAECDIDEGCVTAEFAGRATVSGTLDVSTDFVTDLQLRVGLDIVDIFEAYLEHRIDSNLVFIGEFTAEFEAEKRVAEIRMRTKTYMVGKIPVTITPILELFVGADGSFEAKVTWGAQFEQETLAGVSYQHGDGWNTLWVPDPDPRWRFEDLEADATGQARAWTRARVTPLFYGVIGPYFELRPYLRGELEGSLSVGQTNAIGAEGALFLGVDGQAGVDVTIPVINYTLAEYDTDFNLAEIELLRKDIEFAFSLIGVDLDPVDVSDVATGRIARLIFNANEGDVLEAGVTGLPEGTTSRVVILAPNGEVIYEHYQRDRQASFQVMLADGIEVPSSTTYRMVVFSPIGSEATGTVYLSRQRTEPGELDGDPVPLPDDLRPGQSMLVPFSAPEGRNIDVVLTDLTTTPNDNSYVRLELRDPEGIRIADDAQDPTAPHLVRLAPTALERAGTHTVVVRPPHDGSPLSGRLWIDTRSEVPELAAHSWAVYAQTQSGVVTNRELISWGANGRGQLGLGPMSDRWRPTFNSAELPAPMQNSFATLGGRHTLWIINEQLYASGAGDHGQLGTGDLDDRSLPVPIEGLAVAPFSVAAGAEHSLVLDENGAVHGFGANTRGQLGLGRPSADGENAGTGSADTTYPLPRQITALEGLEIVGIAAGGEHTLFHTADGEVYATGRNDEGQLGLGDRTDRWEPVRVEALRGTEVVRVAAGGRHSLALTADGQVLTFGSNRHGQLGHSDALVHTTPRVIDELTDRSMRQVAAGGDHSMVVTTAGIAYAFGRNDHGQLGLGDRTDRFSPTVVQGPWRELNAVQLGERHTVFFGPDALRQAWGYGAGSGVNGRLGIGDTQDRLVPARIADPVDPPDAPDSGDPTVPRTGSLEWQVLPPDDPG